MSVKLVQPPELENPPGNRPFSEYSPHPPIAYAEPPKFLMIKETDFDAQKAMYQWEVLRACLQTAGAEIKTVDAAPMNERRKKLSSEERRLEDEAEKIAEKNPILTLLGGGGSSGRAETFVRDPAFVIPELKLALFPTEARGWIKADADRMKSLLQKEGYKTVDVPGNFEGGDMLYDPVRKVIVQGTYEGENALGTEGDAAAIEKAVHAVDPAVRVVSMPIPPEVADRSTLYFHLDTVMSVLPNGEILALDALRNNPKSCLAIDQLQAMRPQSKVFTYSDKGADTEIDAANLAAVGNTLVLPRISAKVADQLIDAGYNIITPKRLRCDPKLAEAVIAQMHANGVHQTPHQEPLTVNNFADNVDFGFAGGYGGSVHCVTLELDRGQKISSSDLERGKPHPVAQDTQQIFATADPSKVAALPKTAGNETLQQPTQFIPDPATTSQIELNNNKNQR